MTVNIGSTPDKPAPRYGAPQQLQGKLHYATVGFSIEARDDTATAKIDEVRSYILDKIITHLGKKRFHEITTIEGRYILHSEFLQIINETLVEHKEQAANKEGLIKDLFFTEFVVQ